MVIALLTIFSLFFIPFISHGQPTGTALTSDKLLELLENFGGFLIVAGGILAATVVIVSGILYLISGPNTQRLKAAKDTLKYGIIGALIIFSAGMIIATVKGFGTNPLQFFGASSGGGGGGEACLSCVSGGQTYCIANSTCMPDSTACPGLFTQVPSGCP